MFAVIASSIFLIASAFSAVTLAFTQPITVSSVRSLYATKVSGFSNPKEPTALV